MEKEQVATGREEFMNVVVVFLVVLTAFPILTIIAVFNNIEGQPTVVQTERMLSALWQFSTMLALTTITFGMRCVVSTLDRYEQKQK